MSLWTYLFGVSTPPQSINPANGLPMLNSALDVAGNPYGSDSMSINHADHSYPSATDTFSSSGSSWSSSDSFGS